MVFAISRVLIMKVLETFSLHRAIAQVIGGGKAFRCSVFMLFSIPGRVKDMWLKFIKPLPLVGAEEQILRRKFCRRFSCG